MGERGFTSRLTLPHLLSLELFLLHPQLVDAQALEDEGLCAVIKTLRVSEEKNGSTVDLVSLCLSPLFL